jgi:5-methylcytosine-specific restriction endonuclease McrA
MSNRDLEDPAYVAWRNSVFIRDSFTCQLTQQKGGHLEAHHIIPWAKDESLRFNVSNGITLSKDAHAMVTGKEAKYQEQFQRIVAMKNDDQRKQDEAGMKAGGKTSQTRIIKNGMAIDKTKKWTARNPRRRF